MCLGSLPFLGHSQNYLHSQGFPNCGLVPGAIVEIEEGVDSFRFFSVQVGGCRMFYLTSTNDANSVRYVSAPFDVTYYEDYRFGISTFLQKMNGDGTLKFSAKNESGSYEELLLVLDAQNTTVPDFFPIDPPSSVKHVQLVLEYSGTADQGSYFALESVNLFGPDNDLCDRAILIALDDPCLVGNNIAADYSGPATCVNDLDQCTWFTFQAEETGWIALETNAEYDDVADLFEGPCTALNQVYCSDWDEYGFTGERNEWMIEAGKEYFVRMSAKTNSFPGVEGSHCISLQKIAGPTIINNDLCEQKQIIEVGQTCTESTNIKAKTQGPEPSLNIRSRADVWFSFIANSTKNLKIIPQADFAEVTTVYKGNCQSPEEVHCQDLGGVVLLENPTPGTEYLVQVSGYFATLEGKLCLEVHESDEQIPVNDDCPDAMPLSLNQQGQTINIINAEVATKRPSCIVYKQADIWYEFTTSNAGSYLLDISAGFTYVYALYTGTCADLTEIECQDSPDPCDGYIALDNLQAGKKYYLQIMAATHPIRTLEGELSVSIYENGNEPDFEPLVLNIDIECVDVVLSRIHHSASGGKGAYEFFGDINGELLWPGDSYEIFVQDENECRDFMSGTANCKSPDECDNTDLNLSVGYHCLVDSIGIPLGRAEITLDVIGGLGNVQSYGTMHGEVLDHGTAFRSMVIDSQGCHQIVEGIVDCPPFDCSQSALEIVPTVTCIDTLFKAQLNYTINGNLGAYQVTGPDQGSLLDQNESYKIEVTDATGCSEEIQGIINCHFDSCAYARPTLTVTYDCLVDGSNNKTGQAVLHVSGQSMAGGISYSGNVDGEILNHGDSYETIQHDAFGCDVTVGGIIDCEPTNTAVQDVGDVNIGIAPNPGRDYFYLVVSSQLLDELRSVELTQSQGRVLMSRETDLEQSMRIETADLPAGHYFIRLHTRKQVYTIQWIKI